jgi:hypothetical protein
MRSLPRSPNPWRWLGAAGLLAALALVVAAVSGLFPSRPVPGMPGTPTPTPSASGIPTLAVAGVQGGFTVGGSGWGAQAAISLDLLRAAGSAASYPLGAVRADGAGAFSVAFSWRADQPSGEGTILLARSGAISLTLPFSLLPPTTMPSLQPSSVVLPSATNTATSRAVPTAAETPPPPATMTPSPLPTASRTPTWTPVRPSPTPVPPTPTATPPIITDWRGEYFNNPDVAGAARLVRNDTDINFDWGSGSPDPTIQADSFSARWTRILYLAEGTYRYFLRPDDGARLYVDGALVLDMWALGGARTQSADVYFATGGHLLEVDYFEATGMASISFWWQLIAPASGSGWRGEYYANPDLNGAPTLVRYDPTIDFDWGTGSPDPGIPAQYFSVRWTRDLDLRSGDYRFTVTVDDGARLWVDGVLLIDQWHEGSNTYTANQVLSDDRHSVRLEYFQASGLASVRLRWKRTSPTETATIIPAATGTPTPAPAPATPTDTRPPLPTETAQPPTPTATRLPEPTETRTRVPPTTTETRVRPTESRVLLTPAPTEIAQSAIPFRIVAQGLHDYAFVSAASYAAFGNQADWSAFAAAFGPQPVPLRGLQ